jgi:hypothetical protein
MNVTVTDVRLLDAGFSLQSIGLSPWSDKGAGLYPTGPLLIMIKPLLYSAPWGDMIRQHIINIHFACGPAPCWLQSNYVNLKSKPNSLKVDLVG